MTKANHPPRPEGIRAGRGFPLALFLISSFGICCISLLLATCSIGWKLFFDYFRVPLIFLLNFIPVLVIQLVFLCLFNRLWLSSLLTGLIIIGASVGNSYKVKLRGEPFAFDDIGTIGDGLRIASNYDLRPGTVIILSVICFAVLLAAVIILDRSRLGIKLRAGLLALALVCSFPLYSLVYTNEHIYNVSTWNAYHASLTWPAENYMSKGFVYPFIYSISHNRFSPPEGYDEAEAEALLGRYEDEAIPADRRVNVIIIQLEGFARMDEKGFEGIDPSVYSLMDALEAESIRGNTAVSVYGGGTLATEQSLLTLGYTMPSFKGNYPSTVWYMRDNGYSAVGTHPFVETFYNRERLNVFLGLDDFSFFEDYYSAHFSSLDDSFYSDDLFFSKILSDYTERADAGKNVFSFNISMQGHAPYPSDMLLDGRAYWSSESCPQDIAYSFNNYLALQKDTLTQLTGLIDGLRLRDEPVVLMLYGDHMPDISIDGNSIFAQEGINFDISTRQGFINYYSTPYIIWANDAAKQVCGNDFIGEGETVSIGFLMNVLFEELGWKGSSYMQLTSDIRRSLSVATANGQYIENGEYTLTPSENALQLVRDWRFAERYTADNFTQNK